MTIKRMPSWTEIHTTDGKIFWIFNSRNNHLTLFPDRNVDLVRVDRYTCWGNPFKIRYGHTREEVCEHFYQYAIQRLQKEPNWLDPLKGKNLICWCAPKQCHAEILIELANDVHSTKLHTFAE